MFKGSADDIEKMFKRALSKAATRGQVLYALDGSPLRTVEDAKHAAANVNESEFDARIEIPAQVWVHGICKIVLGLGHVIMLVT
jgi:hypothetical protein